MSSASNDVWNARRAVLRWTAVAALALFAGCGADRREAPAAGTEGAAVTDSAPATLPADTTAAAADTGAASPGDTSVAVATADTAADRPAQRPSTPAPAPKPAAPKPAAPKPAPSKPAAPPAPAAEDTSAPAQDTDAPAPDTAATARADTPSGTTQTADAPLRDEYHQAPKDTVDQTTYDGWKQYNLNCARCHGEDVLGSTIAPHLIMSLKPDGPINTQEAFVEVVCAGRPAKGMPSWCALGMEPAKINQIYSYVKGRSEGKIGPGRPAVQPEG
jgi:hypothetical protein